MRRLISLALILALFCNIAHAGFGGFLQANTAVDVMVGPFIDDADGKTAETGLTITEAEVFLSKNGGNHADKSEATSLSHKGIGNYLCKLDATDTNTEGILTLMIHESGALAVKIDYQVLAQAAYISLMTAKDTGYMGVDVEEVDGTDQTGNDNGADINTIVTAVGIIETDTEMWDTTGEARTMLTGADTPVAKDSTPLTAAEAEAEAVDALESFDLDHLITLACDTGPAIVDHVADNSILAFMLDDTGDISAYDDAKHSQVAIGDDTDTIIVGVNVSSVSADAIEAGDFKTDAIDADALNTDFVTEIWAKALTDIGAGAPSATCSVFTAINRLYMVWRNKVITNGTNDEIEYYNAANTKIMEAPISDDETDFTKSAVGAVD